MQEHIHGRYDHKEKIDAENEGCAELLAEIDALGNEKDRYEDEREHTAIEEGKSRGAHAIVGGNKELGDEIEGVEFEKKLFRALGI